MTIYETCRFLSLASIKAAFGLTRKFCVQKLTGYLYSTMTIFQKICQKIKVNLISPLTKGLNQSYFSNSNDTDLPFYVTDSKKL